MLKKLLVFSTAMISGSLFLNVSAAEAQSEPWVGEIRASGYNFCPRGWAPADGQLLPISQYQALFSLDGTMYGGDGRTTFGLPDLRGRSATGHGQQPGLRSWQQGEKLGTVSETLNALQVPTHTHRAGLRTSEDPADSTSPKGNAIASTVSNSYQTGAPSAAFMHTDTVVVDQAGSASPLSVSNEQPYLGVNYCVALTGIYPSRN